MFGPENFLAQIAYQKTTGATSDYILGTLDYILWFAKNRGSTKFRILFQLKIAGEEGSTKYRKVISIDGPKRSATSSEILIGKYGTDSKLYTDDNLTSQSMGRNKGEGAASWFKVKYEGRDYTPTMQSRWKTNEKGVSRLLLSNRIEASKNILRYIRAFDDFPAIPLVDLWRDIWGNTKPFRS